MKKKKIKSLIGKLAYDYVRHGIEYFSFPYFDLTMRQRNMIHEYFLGNGYIVSKETENVISYRKDK